MTKERRAHRRYPTGERGKMTPLEWESLIGVRTATVVDVSDGGLGLQLDISVPEGIAVRVELSSGNYIGKVVYCRSVGNLFIAGVEVHTSTANVPRRKAEKAEQEAAEKAE